MNEIAFVIAPYGFADTAFPYDGLEPVIDGVSLVDFFKWSDGEIFHAGITDIDRTRAALRDVVSSGGPSAVQVLGCECGDDACSGVTAVVSLQKDGVVWSQLRASSAPVGPQGPRTYDEIGPFTFALEQFVSALAQPTRADAPVREPSDLAGLAAGVPRDHDAWLRAMTLAFGRDFLTPYETEPTRAVVVGGLRAFADAGHPLEATSVREWAQGRRFTDDAVERYVAWFEELNVHPQGS